MAAELRSAQWYGGTDRNAYIHRAWMRRGLPHDHARIDAPDLDVDADSVLISLDVEGRTLTPDVPDAELAAREPHAATVAGHAAPERGWERLYVDHVLGADTGADLDFLVGSSGSGVSRESH